MVFTNNTTGNFSFPTVGTISKTEVTIWIGIQFFLSLLGALLIVLLLMLMSRLHKLKTGSGYLIAHALLVDLTFCLVITPITNIPIYLKQIDFVFPYDCTFTSFLMLLIVYTANWTAVALAANRLIAILLPYWYKRFTSPRFTACVVMMIWSMTMVCAVPTLDLLPGLKHALLPSGSCGVVRNEGVTFAILGTLGTYVPLVLLTIMYSSLFLMFRLGRRFNEGRSESHKNLLKRRLSIAKVLVLSLLWYCLCTLPTVILTMFYGAWWRRDIRLLLYTRTTQILGYAASPVFFLVLRPEYRMAVKRLLNIGDK
ncbi:adenosine receptor A3-like [Paramacrobiotus metropolitanus]|uniref:adenosine receptor A3-like n=1 Tax=Paramacrobiotus metropolitanus TaxID=2943436 RepID=UPI0024463B3B|nr:adenosine receptor A3-like [Paramacrobiotus metropolitanus]